MQCHSEAAFFGYLKYVIVVMSECETRRAQTNFTGISKFARSLTTPFFYYAFDAMMENHVNVNSQTNSNWFLHKSACNGTASKMEKGESHFAECDTWMECDEDVSYLIKNRITDDTLEQRKRESVIGLSSSRQSTVGNNLYSSWFR